MPPSYLDNDKLRLYVQIIRVRGMAIDGLLDDGGDALGDGDVDCIADYSFEIIEVAQAIEIICARSARWTRTMLLARAKKLIRAVT